MSLYYQIPFTFSLLFLVRHLLRCRQRPDPKKPVSTLVILGSGGHTAEMLLLASVFNRDRFVPRTYVAARSDELSVLKAAEADPSATFLTVPRSREVMQSWMSTMWTMALSALHSYWLLLRVRPDIVLCNGPGTCVPLCLEAWLNNWIGISRTKVVFVESICRVQTLSLSGRILLHFADDFLVQWPELAEAYPGSKYIARFV